MIRASGLAYFIVRPGATRAHAHARARMRTHVDDQVRARARARTHARSKRVRVRPPPFTCWNSSLPLLTHSRGLVSTSTHTRTLPKRARTRALQP
eukprot:2172852-Pleurochrysis_carterae.AAC.1